ncbi:hypothetical protein ACIOJD_33940 [Streptomyces sp. NPDC088116]
MLSQEPGQGLGISRLQRHRQQRSAQLMHTMVPDIVHRERLAQRRT